MTAGSVPTISVCIANYNGERLLTSCIESVLAQQNSDGVEIIVHDDASTDGSIALLRSRYPQVVVLESSSNVGYCVGNNRMTSLASGKYILLLNNDAELFPDALATLLAAAENAEQDAILSLPQFDHLTGTLVDRGCLLDPFHYPVPNLDPDRTDVAYVIGACLWIPRRVWEDLGGFPEWLESIAEDMFLCCAARLQGVPVRVLAASGYRHWQGATFGGNRISGGRLSINYRRRYLSERNRLLVAATCSPSLMVLPLLAVHALALLIEGGLLVLMTRSFKPLSSIYWSAIKDALGRWPVALRCRWRIQSQRDTRIHTYLHGFLVIPQKLRLLLRYGVPRLD